MKPFDDDKIFRDTDKSRLDYQKNSLYIIGRVCNYGSQKDFQAMIRYYGKEKVKKEVVEVAYLNNQVLSFLALFLHLPLSAFTCYIRKHSTPQLWNY